MVCFFQHLTENDYREPVQGRDSDRESSRWINSRVRARDNLKEFLNLAIAKKEKKRKITKNKLEKGKKGEKTTRKRKIKLGLYLREPRKRNLEHGKNDGHESEGACHHGAARRH